jgi:hypothetical protein
LGVTGLATFSNSSNTGTLFVNGLTTLNNTTNQGTLGVTGLLTTTGISNTTNISTTNLFSCNVSLSSLQIYDPIQLSTGTFRYSTLTTLFALPNTSLLYFNNLVIGGAYVWPGQTISALNWTGLYQFGAPPSNYVEVTASQPINTYNITIFSNITGGTPPYSASMSPNTLETTANLFFTGTILNNPGSTGGSSGSGFVTFTLKDSSTPQFQRSVLYFWSLGGSPG